MHDIFGNRFYSRQKAAWHRLGETFDLDDEVSVVDAVGKTAVGIEIDAAPLKYVYEGEAYQTDQSAIIRKPTPDDPEPRVFGIASENWTVAQYLDYATALDPLSETFPVETCGVLKGGETLFLALRGDAFAVQSVDEIENYFVCVLSQVPGKGHRVLFTPRRVVCQNTLSLGIRQATINLRIPHTGDPTGTVAFAAQLVTEMTRATEKVQAYFEAMAKTPVGEEGLDRILKEAFPDPAMPTKVRLFQSLTPQQLGVMKNSTTGSRRLNQAIMDAEAAMESWMTSTDRVRQIRDGARVLYSKFNDEHPQFARTVWAAYNAATETSDWREGRGDVDHSVVFGPRSQEKVRAFRAAIELAVGLSMN
ncbi:MAG: DUF932 domain-containing protein [Rhodothermales bacterium]